MCFFFFLQHERCCCRHCSHLTVTPLVPDNLPRSPPINRLAPPRLTLPLTSPPPTHCCPSLSLSSTLSSLEHMSIFFFFPVHYFVLYTPLPPLLVFYLQPPLTCCVGLPCLSLCSLHPLCTVSVSMVTPRGQEWLRGLRDTDTDPNSLHTYFVSRRASFVQPCVHIGEPIPCVMMPLPIITESQDYQGCEMVGGLQPCCFSLRCCSFQLPNEEGDCLMMLQGKLCFPF